MCIVLSLRKNGARKKILGGGANRNNKVVEDAKKGENLFYLKRYI